MITYQKQRITETIAEVKAAIAADEFYYPDSPGDPLNCFQVVVDVSKPLRGKTKFSSYEMGASADSVLKGIIREMILTESDDGGTISPSSLEQVRILKYTPVATGSQ